MKVNLSISHGKFQIELLENNIIYSVLKGTFSEKGSQAYTSSVKHIVEKLDGQPFAILVNNLVLDGGTPEAYTILEAYNLWLNKQAIVAKAFIINGNMTKHIMLKRSPSLQEQNIAFFDTVEKAREWLQKEIATQQNNKVLVTDNS